MTGYHAQAAIAAVHAGAERAESTDWTRILSLYDELVRLNPSPVIQLNRAVALSRVAGPAAALAALEPLASDPALAQYYLLPSVTARLLAELGDHERAIVSYQKALELPCSEPEHRLLRRRLDLLVKDPRKPPEPAEP